RVAAKAGTREGARRWFVLEIDFAYSRRQPRIVGFFQNFHRHRRRTHCAVNQEHLLLGADAPHAALDPARFDHAFKRGYVGEQRLHKSLGLTRVVFGRDVMLTHGSSKVNNLYSALLSARDANRSGWVRAMNVPLENGLFN